MSLAPALPTPLTDLSWIFMPLMDFTPSHGICAKIQLKFMDCLEAYGLQQGHEKCAELFYDMFECNRKTFQVRRAEAIRKERMRQYRAGILSKPFDEYPPLDSFMYME